MTIENMNDSSQQSNITHFITPHSVSVYGESIGHNDVSENVLLALSYDVTYKLYELLRDCKTEMNVYHQISLSSTILNNVFENQSLPTFYGNKTLIPFVSIPNSDMSVLHLTKVDLVEQAACDAVNVAVDQVPILKGIYVSPLSQVYEVANLLKAASSIKAEIKTEPEDDNQPSCSWDTTPRNIRLETKPSIDLESDRKPSNDLTSENFVQSMLQQSQTKRVQREESDYFLVVSQIILNPSETLLKMVLNDLKTNPRLGSVYSSLLNLINNSIKYFKCSGKLIDRLLRVIEALLDNQFVDPSATYSVDATVNTLCTIILEPKTASHCDDFDFRLYTSGVLMRALNTWTVSSKEQRRIISILKQALLHPEKMSLKLNYSVLILFYVLGTDVLNLHFWPALNKYVNELSSFDGIISGKRSLLLTADICHVKSALLLLAGILYRNFWTNDRMVQKLHIISDTILCLYFGETLFPVRAYAISKPITVFQYYSKRIADDEIIVDKTKLDIKKIIESYKKKILDFRNARTSNQLTLLDSVFELSQQPKRNQTINFNFIGSNQINKSQLRVKKLDSRYNVQFNSQCPCRPFLKYERITRIIKYCSTKSACEGDIYVFI